MAADRMTPRPSLRQLRARLPANVVILPTAAPRQVRQPPTRAAMMARQAKRDETAGRFNFTYPGERQADRQAASLRATGTSPGLVLAHAILAALDQETRAKVIYRLASGSGNETVRAALDVAQTTMLTVGEANDLRRALARLAEHDERK